MSLVPPEKFPIVALHKHWLAADAIRHWSKKGIEADGGGPDITGLDFEQMAKFASQLMTVSAWYALLYVVVEGYRSLGLADEVIDALLAEEDKVTLLRRFRNGVFHYQENPLSEKLMDFILAPDTDVWTAGLNRAFKAFFERELNIAEIYGELVKPPSKAN